MAAHTRGGTSLGGEIRQQRNLDGFGFLAVEVHALGNRHNPVFHGRIDNAEADDLDVLRQANAGNTAGTGPLCANTVEGEGEQIARLGDEHSRTLIEVGQLASPHHGVYALERNDVPHVAVIGDFTCGNAFDHAQAGAEHHLGSGVDKGDDLFAAFEFDEVGDLHPARQHGAGGLVRQGRQVDDVDLVHPPLVRQSAQGTAGARGDLRDESVVGSPAAGG